MIRRRVTRRQFLGVAVGTGGVAVGVKSEAATGHSGDR